MAGNNALPQAKEKRSPPKLGVTSIVEMTQHTVRAEVGNDRDRGQAGTGNREQNGGRDQGAGGALLGTPCLVYLSTVSYKKKRRHLEAAAVMTGSPGEQKRML